MIQLFLHLCTFFLKPSMHFRGKMVLQKLITLLLNHPQVGPRLVDKLQDTYLIRRAARATAYFYLRGKHALEEAAKSDVANSAYKGSSSFKDNFQAELKKGFAEARNEFNKKK